MNLLQNKRWSNVLVSLLGTKYDKWQNEYAGTCGSKCQWGSECQVAKLYRFCLTNGVEQCTLNFK